jgi:hypothetical protein
LTKNTAGDWDLKWTTRALLAADAEFVARYASLTGQTFTPTLTQGATPTKTVDVAGHGKAAGQIVGNVKLGVTSAGTGGSTITVGLPVACLGGVNTIIGSAVWYDASTGAYCPAVLLAASATTAVLVDSTQTTVGVFLGQTGSANNSAVGSGDIITYSFAYTPA